MRIQEYTWAIYLPNKDKENSHNSTINRVVKERTRGKFFTKYSKTRTIEKCNIKLALFLRNSIINLAK